MLGFDDRPQYIGKCELCKRELHLGTETWDCDDFAYTPDGIICWDCWDDYGRKLILEQTGRRV